MLPELYELPVAQQITDAFNGYNHNLRIGQGEMWDMTNLTSDNFPTLSPRRQRGIYAIPKHTAGLIAKDKLCYVDGSAFVLGDQVIEMGLSTAPEDVPKRLISMGANVIILPDKKYINTADIEDRGGIEVKYTSSGTVTFKLCKVDGTEYVDMITSADEPKEPKNGQVWLDTSKKPNELKQWSTVTGIWTQILSTYVKIEATGIGADFELRDGVELDGITAEELKVMNANMTIWAKGPDYIVVTGIIDKVVTQNTPITVERLMPLMDYMTEANNRLWGCRYGLSNKGEFVNEIYASKLGDFKNWRSFPGISTDSYIASCGTDGPFTGAITHMGYPLFFKENMLHKVYGTMPANFQIQQTACRGVQQGCDRSMALVNEVLYYKSRTAVCAYDGSLPTEISYQLGEENYHNAVAGGCGNKYYISMADDKDEYSIFVYDTKKKMWHREDNLQVDDWASLRGEMYFVEHDTKAILTVYGTGTLKTEPVKWEAISGTMGAEDPQHRNINRITVKLSVDVGSDVRISIEYDSSGHYEPVLHHRGSRLGSISLPIRPRRCDHLRIKIEGEGPCKIYSITKTFERGSEI